MPSNTPLFRPMRPGDENAIAAMMKSLYKALHAPDNYMTDKKINATFEQVRKQSGYLQIDVFEIGGEITGYATLFKYWYNEFGGMVLNVDELFVKPEFRDRGIATLYLTELSKNTKEFVAMSLEVLPANKGAFSLYKRAGFAAKETVALYKMLEDVRLR